MSVPEQPDRPIPLQQAGEQQAGEQQIGSQQIGSQQTSGQQNQAIGSMSGDSKAVGSARDVYFQEVTQQAAERVTSRFQLPPAVADFTGRTVELAKIEAVLGTTDGAVSLSISAVAGMAGVGKSALAVYAAHGLAAQFPDAQLYVNLQGADEAQPREPGDVLGEWLRALGLDGAEIPAGLDARVAAYRSQLANQRALVVLDNALNEDQVRPLLPGGAGCAVLVTSRQSLAALAGTQEIRLKTLLPDEALALLAQLAGEERVAAEPAAAAEIVKLCGYLPLAIRIAGGVLKGKGHWGLAADYLPQLRDEKLRLGQLAQVGGEDVRASFNLSYQQLSATEQALFSQLGVLSGEFGLLVAAAVGELESEAAREILEGLIDAQLVESVARGRYRFHDLMRLYAKALLGAGAVMAAEERSFRWYAGGANYFENAFSPQRRRRMVSAQHEGTVDEAVEQRFVQTALSWFEVERLNLLAAFDWGYEQKKHQEIISFSGNLVDFFRIRGYWKDWETTQLKALASAQKSGATRGESQTLNNLGLVYKFQGRWEEAIAQFEQSLEIKRTLGNPCGEGDTLNNLGMVYDSQGRWEEALVQYQKSLDVYRALGDRHGEGQALNNLGLVYYSQGLWEKAITQYEQSLEICRALGDRHGKGTALSNLGLVYRSQSRLEEAIAQFEQSLEIKRMLGDRHGESKNLNNLGLVYYSQGRLEEASAQFEADLKICRALGDRHGKGTALNNLGLVYKSQGRLEKAIAQYEQSLEIFRALGDRHGEGLTLYNLGNLYQQRLQYDKAIDYWQNAQTKIHPDAPAAKRLAQKLKNPYGISTKQILIGCLPQLALLIFAALNLIRGHWPLALIIVLAWACFLTYRIWRIRRGHRT